MKKKSKKLKDLKIEKGKNHSVDEALKFIVEHPMAKFDESIDVAVGLSIDTKQSGQQVRGAVPLPHGLGRDVRVIVFAKGENEEKARQAGACEVGSEDLVEKIKGGWMEFDKVVASPDQMSVVSKLAPLLGPRGLMPNPKMGTVTKEPHKAVEAEKKGKASFRAVQSGKNGLVHSSIGKRSLGFEKLKENYKAFMDAVLRAKPASSKGIYLQFVCLSSTMGPGLFVKRGGE